jgi:hypothetical protein
MEMLPEDEEHMVVLRYEKKSIVVKLVADRLAQKDVVTLRSGDMDSLGVNEGDEISIEPYHKIKDELKESWKKFVSRFKKKKDEEEEGGE